MANVNDGQTAQGPNLSVVLQYVKDLSFENPGAPQSAAPPCRLAQHQHFDRRPVRGDRRQPVRG